MIEVLIILAFLCCQVNWREFLHHDWSIGVDRVMGWYSFNIFHYELRCWRKRCE